jgi:hypothetical protein
MCGLYASMDMWAVRQHAYMGCTPSPAAARAHARAHLDGGVHPRRGRAADEERDVHVEPLQDATG